MRTALPVLCILAACGEPKFVAQPLPDLIANPTRAPISVPRLMLPDGERLRFEVHHKGFTIGRAELVVGGARITSRFRTSQLASMFATASHELTTTLAHAGTYPDTSNEAVDVDGESERYEVMFDRSNYMIGGKARRIPEGVGHTMHTALGVLRAWAVERARPGFIMVLHTGELFRLDVDSPIPEDWRGTKTLKIEGRIVDSAKTAKPILVTLWLTANTQRTPIRLAISQDGKTIDAEKIDD
jgi:hypothetical protein